MRLCVEDGCEREHYGRGWCRFHYQRAYLAGRLEDRPRELVRPTATLDERLRHFGWTVTRHGCWEWNGGRNATGYGQLAVGAGRPWLASRAAYTAWVGPIPDGQVVCHTCDNPPCINPSHLFAGRRRDNNRDMADKRRSSNGERRPQHKLKDVQVAEIRRAYIRGGPTQRALAKQYGVSQQLISHLVRGSRRVHATYLPSRSAGAT